MARKKKRSSKGYAIFMVAYILLVICVVSFVLSKVWDYAEEYELSQPSNTMDEYVAQLNANLSNDTIEATVAEMDHEMQSDEECCEIIEGLLSSGVTYSRGPSGGEEGVICYVLKCGEGTFGKVYLKEDLSNKEESQFGMYPWVIHREEFDFTGLYTGIEVTVPESYGVYLNGNKLGDEYIVEDGIHYDVLEEYYEDYSKLPTKVTYRFENIIGRMEPVIKDADGNEVTIDTTRDDSQYLRSCSEKEQAALLSFSEKFCQEYYTFIGGKYDPTYGYQRLMPYIKLGSDLDERLKLAIDGLYYSHTKSVVVDSVSVDNTLWLEDGLYLCMVTATFTTHAADNTVEQQTDNMKLIVVETAGDYRAVSQELY